jgi:hypothetical protein
MATLDIQPLVMKDVLLVLGASGDDFRKHVDQVTFNPPSAPSAITWTGLGLNTHTDRGTPTEDWTVTLNYAQDWESTNSLSQYLFDHHGDPEPIAARFEPKAGGPAFEAEVYVVSGAIGGSVNVFATASVTLPTTGKPTRVAAA